MSHFYDEITTALPELQVLKDEPMSRHTTFRIGGPADYFVCPDREQIAEVLAVAKKCGMAITVIGNGSNLLVGDKGIRGLVVEIGSAMNQITVDKEHITAGQAHCCHRSQQKRPQQNSVEWSLPQEFLEVSVEL